VLTAYVTCTCQSDKRKIEGTYDVHLHVIYHMQLLCQSTIRIHTHVVNRRRRLKCPFHASSHKTHMRIQTQIRIAEPWPQYHTSSLPPQKVSMYSSVIPKSSFVPISSFEPLIRPGLHDRRTCLRGTLQAYPRPWMNSSKCSLAEIQTYSACSERDVTFLCKGGSRRI
jgi:hypothetical protein